MAEVEVQIAPAFEQELSAEGLSAVAMEVLRQEDTTGQVTLVITDDQGIRELNRDFLGIDAPTDVLAFSAQEEMRPLSSLPKPRDTWAM